MRVLGIDPGLSGGLAVVDNVGLVALGVMPVTSRFSKNIVDILGTRNWLDTIRPPVGLVVIERQSARKGNSSAALSTSQMNYGRILGLFEWLEWQVEIVEPRVWQNRMIARYLPRWNKKDPKRTKKASIAYCGEHFPRANLMATSRCKVEHDGMADALCIAKFGLEVYGGKG